MSPAAPVHRDVHVVIIGGGQSGLATGYHLRRQGLAPGEDFVIVDDAATPGGAWTRMWENLRLFSPATYSSLPGWMMPAWDDAAYGYPPRTHVVDYLTRYEDFYELRVERPHRVHAIEDLADGRLLVRGDGLELRTRFVVSATGTWGAPFWPHYPGAGTFTGTQLHAHDYQSTADHAGRRVVIVGGGNSAAQILADVSEVAETTWVTNRPPRFLPDEVDGRDLFAAATARITALREGRQHDGVGGLGDIVMVDSVRRARDRGALVAQPMFTHVTPDGVAWADTATPGTQSADTIIWATGFRPMLHHLRRLRLRDREGHVAVGGPAGTRAHADPRIHLVGYGDWTGLASATLLGVGRSARSTAEEIASLLRHCHSLPSVWRCILGGREAPSPARARSWQTPL